VYFGTGSLTQKKKRKEKELTKKNYRENEEEDAKDPL